MEAAADERFEVREHIQAILVNVRNCAFSEVLKLGSAKKLLSIEPEDPPEDLPNKNLESVRKLCGF